MSLITRCPACGTMFKVVTDQLKVSQGWVRCGHCAEVFDASLHLQAPRTAVAPLPEPVVLAGPVVETTADAGWSPGASFADRSRVRNDRGAPGANDAGDADDEASEFDPVHWKHQQTRLDELGMLHVDSGGAAVRTYLQQASAADTTEELPQQQSRPSQDREDSDLFEPSELPAAESDVSFVRDARRQAFWRKPLVRVALGGLGALLLVVLALQFVAQQKDGIAAAEPRLKPMLQGLCEVLQCEVGPLRQIESVVIDSSAFNKISADAYRLSFSIKNTGSVAVAMPSLEVTLTDSQEQALVRRVLTPAQLGAVSGLLAAGADFAGSVAMQVRASSALASSRAATSAAVGLDGLADVPPPLPPGPLRIAGYRVLAFYP